MNSEHGLFFFALNINFYSQLNICILAVFVPEILSDFAHSLLRRKAMTSWRASGWPSAAFPATFADVSRGRIEVCWNSAVEPDEHMEIMTLQREIYRPQHMYMAFFMGTMTPTHVFHEIGMPGREEQLEKASGVHRFIGHLSCHGHQCHE